MIEVKADKKGTVKISGELTLVNVGELQEKLISALDTTSCKTLDCSGITGVDTASLQVLLAFKRSASTSQTVKVTASDSMHGVMAMLGLSKAFMGA